MRSRDCEPVFTTSDITRFDKTELKDAYIWFMVKKHQLEMFQDRGLTIPEEERFLLEYDSEREPLKDWEARTIPYFVGKYRRKASELDVNFNSALSQVYLDETTNIKTVAIYLCRRTESSNITTAEFTSKFNYYRSEHYEDGKQLNMVFISEVDVKDSKENSSCLHYIKCQFFLTRDLLINPTRFVYYFPHTLLNEEERKRELTDNNIRPDQLPIILKSDPIVKYFNWQAGGVVKIQRTQRYLEVPASEGIYLRLIK